MTAVLEPKTTDTVEALAPTHTGSITVVGGPLAGVTTWDTRFEDTVQEAERAFAAAKERGYYAYESKEGADDTITHSFDPEADAVVFAAPLIGG